MSHSSRSLRLGSEMAFYSRNEVNLNRKKPRKFLEEQTKVHKDPLYILEEIHKMVDVADERGKTFLLLLASTVIRIGAIQAIFLLVLIK